MKKNLIPYTAIVLLLLFSDESFSQSWFSNVRRDQNRSRYQDLFMYELASFPDGDSCEVVLYAGITNDLLQFIFEDSLFIAGYEMSVIFKTAGDEPAAGKIIRNRTTANSYAETNSRSIRSNERVTFRLKNGEYRIFISLEDLETRNPIEIEEKITLPQYRSGSITSSPLLFFSLGDTSSFDLEESFPVLPPSRATVDSQFTSVAVLDVPENSSLEITCRLLDRHGEALRSSRITAAPSESFHPVFIPLRETLNFGQYTLELTVSTGQSRLILEQGFTVRWGTHTTYLPELEKTVEIMQYIMSGSEWNALKKVSERDQEKTLEAFWKERDPNPDTEENELEEEYFRRVAFANQNFSPWPDNTEGWRTDRGRIYILYGPPSEVERPSTSTGERSRYEIWYFENIQRRFVFVDKFGTEEYRLVSEE